MILVTGFEPFGGVTVNPTQDIVERLQRRPLPGVTAEVLPTAYRRGARMMTELLHTRRPRVVLMTGLNASAQNLRYEQVALNFDHAAKPDNDGEARQLRHIRERGPVGYWNTLPFDALRSVADEFGETLEVSRDAGGFVCNHVFFTAMDVITTQLPETRAGFVHVPSLDDTRLARIVDVLTAWLRNLEH
jgi:pyroglutamyl-peptidase